MTNYNFDVYYPSLWNLLENDFDFCKRKPRVLVKVDDSDLGFDATEFDKWYLAELRIQNPGEYYTSPDGQMLFWKDGHGRVVLLCCLDNTEKVVIPQGVTEIGRYAFSENQLRSVIMPDSVLEIDDAAFAGCENLRKVRFSSNLQVISRSAFRESGLEKVLIPSSVMRIGNFAFADCSQLRVFRTEGDEDMIEVAVKAFCGCPNLRRAPQGVSTAPDKKVSFFDAFKSRLETIKKFCLV